MKSTDVKIMIIDEKSFNFFCPSLRLRMHKETENYNCKGVNVAKKK